MFGYDPEIEDEDDGEKLAAKEKSVDSGLGDLKLKLSGSEPSLGGGQLKLGEGLGGGLKLGGGGLGEGSGGGLGSGTGAGPSLGGEDLKLDMNLKQ